MSISSLLGRSFESAAWFCVLSSCVTTVPPTALRKWEKDLADAAIRACAERGGNALVGDDRVVSCTPCALANARTP